MSKSRSQIKVKTLITGILRLTRDFLPEKSDRVSPVTHIEGSKIVK